MAEDTLTIRAATMADLAAVDALLAASYPAQLAAHYAPSVMVTAVPLICRAQPRLLRSGSYFLLCRSDGAILAAGGWSWTAPAGGLGPMDLGHIRHVVTDHRHARRGLGRRLMAHVIDSARTAGVGRLDCLSTLAAVPFYEAIGFAQVGDVQIRLAPGILLPAVQMRL